LLMASKKPAEVTCSIFSKHALASAEALLRDLCAPEGQV
jgi:hypothetical protein